MQYLSTSELAYRLNISSRTVVNMIQRGEIEGFRVGRQWRICPASVEQWLDARTGIPPSPPGDTHPRQQAAQVCRPQAITMAELQLVPRGPVAIDLANGRSAHANATQEVEVSEWLTVSQAAEKLCDIVSNIDLPKARARVSAAANRGEFRTNGRHRHDRRIDRDTLNTWLMKQRDRDLSRSDADNW